MDSHPSLPNVAAYLGCSEAEAWDRPILAYVHSTTCPRTLRGTLRTLALELERIELAGDPVFIDRDETEPGWTHPTMPISEDAALDPWIIGDVAKMLREDPPPVQWLVEGLIPAGAPGLFAARAGAGKSMTALLIALGLASGRGVLGRKVSPEAARGVLYVGMEDDEPEFWRRLRNGLDLMREDPQWTPRDEAQLEARLVPIFPRREVCGDFRLEGQWRNLRDLAGAIPGGCGLIILDTFARLSGGDENSAKETRPFLEAQNGLAHATGAAVMAIHHVGKGNDTPSDKALWQRLHPEALRGSSAIEGAARFIITMAALSPAEVERSGLEMEQAHKGGYVALSLAKMSQGEKGATLLLERRPAGAVGAGFLCPHPESERILAGLQGGGAVLKLNLRDKVLLAIAEAGGLGDLDQAAAAAIIWTDIKNPLSQWRKHLSEIRNRGWLRDPHLTGAGMAHAESLGFHSARNRMVDHDGAKTQSPCMIPPGMGIPESPEPAPLRPVDSDSTSLGETEWMEYSIQDGNSGSIPDVSGDGSILIPSIPVPLGPVESESCLFVDPLDDLAGFR